MRTLLLSVALLLMGCSQGPVVQPANAPPTGTIWFGSTFDPSTLALNGQTTSLASGSSVALVGHLPRAISGNVAELRVSVNGQMVATQPLALTGSGDIFGTTWTGAGVFGPGAYRFDVIDIGGNVLASGTLGVT